MRATSRWTRVVLALLCAFGLVLGSVQAKEAVYQTGFDEWLAADGGFDSWEVTGTRLSDSGELVLDPTSAALETDPYYAGDYYGGNYYTGGSYLVGEASGPDTPTGFDFDELIASWNAVTPEGTWIEVLVRAELNEQQWTQWYNLGIWASGLETIQRHSVRDQRDDLARIAVDTLKISDSQAFAGTYQLKVRLFSVDDLTTPSVRYISAAYSTEPRKNSVPSTGNREYWDTLLDVPECSQMVYEGGNVWCSPTSTAMIVSYWENYNGSCKPAVRAAVDGVYDWVYGGTGNWPFNTAYAATYGLQGSVRRLGSLDEIEEWVYQGVPVAISFSWGKGQLEDAAVNSSGGHLAVVVGFDEHGDPIVNDPAADPEDDEVVQRTYEREELEAVWLENSGGTVYLIKK